MIKNSRSWIIGKKHHCDCWAALCLLTPPQKKKKVRVIFHKTSPWRNDVWHLTFLYYGWFKKKKKNCRWLFVYAAAYGTDNVDLEAGVTCVLQKHWRVFCINVLWVGSLKLETIHSYGDKLSINPSSFLKSGRYLRYPCSTLLSIESKQDKFDLPIQFWWDSDPT